MIAAPALSESGEDETKERIVARSYTVAKGDSYRKIAAAMMGNAKLAETLAGASRSTRTCAPSRWEPTATWILVCSI